MNFDRTKSKSPLFQWERVKVRADRRSNIACSMRIASFRLFPVWIFALCLCTPSMTTAVEAKEEVPQGYEDAAEADAKPAAGGPMGGGMAVEAPRKDLKKPAEENVDPHVAQLERQFRPQFQQMLKVEIAFIRRACDMDQAQCEAVAKAGQQCVSDVLRQCAIAQQKMEQGGFQPDSMPNAPKLMREQIAEVAMKSLRPEQIERYRRESVERAASRKLAVVRYMVAKADQTLALSTQQREKLVLALTKTYLEHWEQTMTLWMQNPQFVPSIPDPQILPLLNEKQAAVWQKMPKSNQVVVHMSWMMAPGIAVIQE